MIVSAHSGVGSIFSAFSMMVLRAFMVVIVWRLEKLLVWYPRDIGMIICIMGYSVSGNEISKAP